VLAVVARVARMRVGAIMTKRILVADKMSDLGVSVMKASSALSVDVKTGLSVDDQVKIIGEYDGLVVRSTTKLKGALLDAAKNLEIVIRAGIGVDNIDVKACKERGIVVENTPMGNANSAAEHAIALLFSLARQLPEATVSTKAGKWEKNRFMGVELAGKTLGVIGTGNIGRIVVERGRGLGMTVIAFDPMLTDHRAAELQVEKVSLDALLSRADAISLHVPLIDSTKHLLNDAAFAKMKKGVLIVNAARGGVIDEGALDRALDSGKVWGAALDVFETEPVDPNHPLLKRENVIATPHLGASTHDAQEKVAVEAGEQMVLFFEKGEKRNAL
jgi:D-3-phosphoglycerate dehydrogenase